MKNKDGRLKDIELRINYIQKKLDKLKILVEEYKGRLK